MIINLSPIAYDTRTLTLSKTGDVLTINGTDYDFSFMNEDDTLPANAITSDFILNSVHKISGQIVVTIQFPYVEATPERRFPEPITVTEDGPITLP